MMGFSNTPGKRRVRLTPLSEIKEQFYRGGWGPWRLDRKYYVLYLRLPNGRRRYEVDLEDCRTSARTLDWIFQVATKTWADAAVMAGLTNALRDTLDPQANLCSFGEDNALSQEEIRERCRRVPVDAQGRLAPDAA